MSEPTQTPITDALARSMREWITPDGPHVCMIEDAVKLVLHARDLERVAKRLAEELASECNCGLCRSCELVAEFAKMMPKEK